MYINIYGKFSIIFSYRVNNTDKSMSVGVLGSSSSLAVVWILRI